MPVVLVVAGLFFVALGLVLRWYRAEQRAGAVDMAYAEVSRIPTPDGSGFDLRRLPGDGGKPVLLVHGIAANHRNVDLHPGRSLARYLRAAGRDVWLLTLRSGRGDRRRTEPVGFSAMARHDVPMAVAAVRERTGADRVDYVGFSMGGMLLYASLGRTLPEGWLRRAVIIGSPVWVALPIPWSRSPVVRMLARLVPTLPLRSLSALVATLAEVLHTPLHPLIYNPRNVSAGDTRRSLVNIIADIPGPLVRELGAWATTDRHIRLEDGRTAMEALQEVSVPVQFFAGAADRVAPPRAVRRAYLAWGRRRDGVVSRYTLLGRRTGAADDYGHGDLAIGRCLDDDLHDPIRAFLDAEWGDPFTGGGD